MESLIDKLEKLILKSYNDDDPEQSVRTVEMINITTEMRKKVVIKDCRTCMHRSASRYVEPCYGCADDDNYINYEPATNS